MIIPLYNPTVTFDRINGDWHGLAGVDGTSNELSPTHPCPKSPFRAALNPSPTWPQMDGRPLIRDVSSSDPLDCGPRIPLHLKLARNQSYDLAPTTSLLRYVIFSIGDRPDFPPNLNEVLSAAFSPSNSAQYSSPTLGTINGT